MYFRFCRLARYRFADARGVDKIRKTFNFVFIFMLIHEKLIHENLLKNPKKFFLIYFAY